MKSRISSKSEEKEISSTSTFFSSNNGDQYQLEKLVWAILHEDIEFIERILSRYPYLIDCTTSYQVKYIQPAVQLRSFYLPFI